MACKHIVLVIPLALAAFVLGGRTAHACSCAQKPTVLEAYTSANIIVLARVMSVDKVETADDTVRTNAVNGVRSARVLVEKVFKGTLKPGEEMIFGQGGGADCIWTFSAKSIGVRFLFYLAAPDKDQKIWWAGTCGRSTTAEHAADDLLYLENMENVRGKTRLSGTLRFYQVSPIEGEESIYKRVEGRRLRIVGEKQTYEVITNFAGVYEIYDLPGGSYQVEPEIPEGWKINHSNPSLVRDRSERRGLSAQQKKGFQVSIEVGKHAYLDFEYGVNNAIRGRLLDNAGNGMKDVCVNVLPAHGKASRYLYKADCTNGYGAFEINGIPPGSYVLAVNRLGKISSSAPFRTFYYPNVSEREKAAVITIVAGQMMEGFNVYPPTIEETVTIEGAAYYSDGKPVVEGSVYFKADKVDDGIDGNASAATDSSGHFAIKVLKGLKGTLYSEMDAYPGKYENCPKLDELLKKSEGFTSLRTTVIEVQDNNVSNAVLKYPFPACKRAP